jgi:hypothetical protein
VTRVCVTCQDEKPITDFYRNKGSLDGYLRRCKRCVVDRYRSGVSERAKRDRLYFQQIKVERGCTDCGYSANPVALDFDHLPGQVKVYRVCTMAGMRRELIDAEIAKCEVVCANCHRVRTNERLYESAEDDVDDVAV